MKFVFHHIRFEQVCKAIDLWVGKRTVYKTKVYSLQHQQLIKIKGAI